MREISTVMTLITKCFHQIGRLKLPLLQPEKKAPGSLHTDVNEAQKDGISCALHLSPNLRGCDSLCTIINC